MSTQWVPIWVEDDKTASMAAELRELWSAETTPTGVKGHNKLLGRQRSHRAGAGRKRGGKGKKGGGKGGGKGKKGGVKGKSGKSKCTGNKGGAQGKKGGGNQGGGQDMSGLGVAHVKCPKGSVGRDLYVRAFCKLAEQKQQQQLSSKRNFSSNFSSSAQLFRKAVRSLREYVPAPPAAASSRTTSAARAPPHPPSWRSCAERSDIIEL